MAESINLFLPTRQAKYFLRAHWTRNWPDSPSGKSVGRAVRSARENLKFFFPICRAACQETTLFRLEGVSPREAPTGIDISETQLASPATRVSPIK
jgi:hypothetical protein